MSLLGEGGTSLDGVEIILQQISEHEEQAEDGTIVTTTEVANTEEVYTCMDYYRPHPKHGERNVFTGVRPFRGGYPNPLVPGPVWERGEPSPLLLAAWGEGGEGTPVLWSQVLSRGRLGLPNLSSQVLSGVVP